MNRKAFIKRIAIAIIAGVVILSVSPAMITEAKLQVVKYGDVNGDGVVSSRDALLTLQYVADLTDFTSDQYTKADYDGNMVINADDALLILKKTAKLI